MGWLSKLLGESAAAPIKAIGDIVDDIHTSDEEESAASLKLVEIKAKLQGLQAEITKQEATHRSLFIAGWRPGLAWLCIMIMFFNYIFVPIATALGYPIKGIDDPEHIENILLGFTGLVAYRTVEKVKGLTR